MKHRYLLLLAFGALLFSTATASAAYEAQPDTPRFKPVVPVYRDVVGDSAVIPKSRMDQERDFLEGTYLYPPKPRNQWEVGLNGGGFFISGDVRTKGGYGFGLSVRKAIGYVISLKAQYFHGMTFGQNFYANAGIANNSVLNHGSTDYFNANPTHAFFMNYKNVTDELTAQMIFTVNNIGFHKRAIDRKVNLYVGFGGGAMGYQAWYDALDANGAQYDFSGIPINATYKDRKPVLKSLKALLDGKYETPAEGQPTQPGFGKGTLRPVVVGSVGMGFHLSKRLHLTISEKITLTHDDLIDGQRWQEHSFADPALTSNFDTYHYISAELGFFFGAKKSVEPLYWQNPMEYTYDVLNTLMKKNVDDLIDTDDDGVIDRLDREPNSAPGALVDTHGVTRDSDGDGIPDFKDIEPYSPVGVKVDSIGRSMEKPLYKSTLDSIIRGEIVVEPAPGGVAPSGGTTGGGGPVVVGGGSAGYCVMTAFPTVNFELDKYNIQPEFFAHLHEVALAMISCPDKKMIAIGNTDARESDEYNNVLSWQRVNKCIDFLTHNYGISRDRFIVKFVGEARPLFPGLPDKGLDAKFEARQYLNRRVEFRWAAPGETGPSNPPRPKGPTNVGKEW